MGKSRDDTFIAERRAVEAVNILIKRDPLFIGVRHSERNDKYDAVGIDVRIYLANLPFEKFEFVPLQVKSWVGRGSKRQEIIRKHCKKYPHIPLIMIRSNHDVKKLANSIREIVLKYLRKNKIPT